MKKTTLLPLTQEYIDLMRTTAAILSEETLNRGNTALSKLSERFTAEHGLDFEWSVCENDWTLFFAYMTAINFAKGGVSAEGKFRNILRSPGMFPRFEEFTDTQINMLFPKKKKRKK